MPSGLITTAGARRADRLVTGSEVCARAFRDGWRPDPHLTVSQWAANHRILGGRTGQGETPWLNEETPYLVEIMDALGARHPARKVVFEKGAQIGGTEAGLNWLGYIMHHAPAPTLMMRPGEQEARGFSRQRIEPLISLCPALREVVRDSRSPDGGNSLLVKEFTGGIFFLIGANSAARAKSMPIRYLLVDEVDECHGDIGEQGDAIGLAEKRLSGPHFSRRKIYLNGTPTVKGQSRIDQEYLSTDQRRYFVPCVHCGHFDWIRRENLRCDDNNPRTTTLHCVVCGGSMEERFKPQLLARGRWIATATGSSPDTIGFHLSSLYSPLGWLSWAAVLEEWFLAQRDLSKLRIAINQTLGEPWEDRSAGVDPEKVLDALVAPGRRERYAADVPHGVGVLVASVDVHGDRLECTVKGYGASEESWLIAFHQFHGSPSQDQVWLELDAFLRQEFEHESGRKVTIACTAIDSGGHHSEEVYKFCSQRLGRRVFAVRGGKELSKPVVGRPTTNNRYRAKLFTLCTDTAKEIIFARLCIGVSQADSATAGDISRGGPGYMHFPEWIDDEYLTQLAASEKPLYRWKRGRGTARSWEPLRERNEGLDLEVYCLAALYILGPTIVRQLPDLAAALSAPAGQEAAAEDPDDLPMPAPRRRGWVDGWRG